MAKQTIADMSHIANIRKKGKPRKSKKNKYGLRRKGRKN
jgi:hypothetical protein